MALQGAILASVNSDLEVVAWRRAWTLLDVDAIHRGGTPAGWVSPPGGMATSPRLSLWLRRWDSRTWEEIRPPAVNRDVQFRGNAALVDHTPWYTSRIGIVPARGVSVLRTLTKFYIEVGNCAARGFLNSSSGVLLQSSRTWRRSRQLYSRVWHACPPPAGRWSEVWGPGRHQSTHLFWRANHSWHWAVS